MNKSFLPLLLPLVIAGCSGSSAGKELVDRMIPDPKPSGPLPVDPYQQETTLLEAQLDGIQFVGLPNEEEQAIFIASSKEVRERLEVDESLRLELRRKMPVEIWVQMGKPNFKFETLDLDASRTYISMGTFATANELIRFLRTIPDRDSSPEIVQRIAF